MIIQLPTILIFLIVFTIVEVRQGTREGGKRKSGDFELDYDLDTGDQTLTLAYTYTRHLILTKQRTRTLS